MSTKPSPFVPFKSRFLTQLLVHLSVTSHTDILGIPVTVVSKEVPFCTTVQEIRHEKLGEREGITILLSNNSLILIDEEGGCYYQKTKHHVPERCPIHVGRGQGKILSTCKGRIVF